MTTQFEVRNNGINNIDWLLSLYRGKEVTEQSIRGLKDEVFESFINVPSMDFSSNGVSVTIVDYDAMTTCEIIYA